MSNSPVSADAAARSVLVTGGCGFLGSHVVDAFLAEGRFRVVAVSRNPNRNRHPEAEYISCDVTKHDEIAAVIQRVKPTVIVHTVTPGPFAPARSHHEDYAATKNLVAVAAKAASVRAFIYSGSAEAVSNFSGARSEPLPETKAILHTPDSTASAYGRAKSASETLVLEANGQDLLTVVLRLPGMFGPRDVNISHNLLKATGTFATRIQLGNNKVVHDWLYVENAAHAHVLAAKALLDPEQAARQRVDGEAFFLSDGVPMKFWDFARKLWAAAGDERCIRGDRVFVIPWSVVLAMAILSEAICYVFTWGRKTPGLTRLHVHYMKEGAWFDIEKARQRLGYVPLVETDEGIRRTAAWFQERSRGARKTT
ncbi:C-3 sterol dehydrogenase/C-4 decarboxylase-like protein [Trematosphaeria pertusa]|uniref:C-3 sterol dehydrogenase/C-4 decarboxylase-like protein n=1 Tax=Trematosphaeria pertusa TaxID=390896 RepID=A0A6A6J3Y9_9PLEO|nr:C-3 sterol dehydrogenase/C-4 decarboxylase-like protein [Trematosphaeria pertusa]KAF2256922.1 C-3 sterol dehydrogenase/C-4 decarboxylase-like protein [Trematosphaeria pertusa]